MVAKSLQHFGHAHVSTLHTTHFMTVPFVIVLYDNTNFYQNSLCLLVYNTMIIKRVLVLTMYYDDVLDGIFHLLACRFRSCCESLFSSLLKPITRTTTGE